MLISIMLLGQINTSLPLELAVVGLGFFNGMFAVAAIGSMMSLAGSGSKRREGTRMGLWGAAQAIAAGFGGLLGTFGGSWTILQHSRKRRGRYFNDQK